MLAISLTLVVLISAALLLYQYATGALLPADDAAPDRHSDTPEEPATPGAARAA
jgi:hypothetical protein